MASVEFSRKFCISERMLEEQWVLRQRLKKRSEFDPFYVSTRNRDSAPNAASRISDLFGWRRTNALHTAGEPFRGPLSPPDRFSQRKHRSYHPPPPRSGCRIDPGRNPKGRNTQQSARDTAHTRPVASRSSHHIELGIDRMGDGQPHHWGAAPPYGGRFRAGRGDAPIAKARLDAPCRAGPLHGDAPLAQALEP